LAGKIQKNPKNIEKITYIAEHAENAKIPKNHENFRKLQ